MFDEQEYTPLPGLDERGHTGTITQELLEGETVDIRTLITESFSSAWAGLEPPAKANGFPTDFISFVEASPYVNIEGPTTISLYWINPDNVPAEPEEE